MQTFKTGRPSPALIVAAAALTFALAGTAVAASPVAKLNKAKVRAIANQEIDRRESGLSVLKAKSADTATNATNATNAASAANAAKLGDVVASQYLRGNACQQGTVLGFARFNPGAMAADPNYSTAGVSVTRNCTGGTVEASRIVTGQYRIRFNGLNAEITICNVEEDGDHLPTVNFLPTSLISPGHWRVSQYNAGVQQFDDSEFTCIVP